MIEISKNTGTGLDYENALFVIKSISTDESRPFMCVVHAEETETGSRLVCTDGRRLHHAEIAQKIPTGEYKPLITKIAVYLKGPVDEGQFPNWQRVIPENGTDRGIINLEKTSIGRNLSQNAGFSIAFSQIIEKTGEVVNIRYLEDLPKTEWKVLSSEEKNRPLVFKRQVSGREIVAVIMPMIGAA
ncbi:hypothetical protein K7J14_12520 [Treponema zuelzerae]|uniref:Uncharacterized protein n=1 Tax=Teretinema zuelzerae TaxID=156 RepID=A0AAE3ELD5_9SPIR|nr:hypothetical protein [Teretinema zuelzerae]MCD1655519.1 hypothetical protein [Teretinema zuelzerae]